MKQLSRDFSDTLAAFDSDISKFIFEVATVEGFDVQTAKMIVGETETRLWELAAEVPGHQETCRHGKIVIKSSLGLETWNEFMLAALDEVLKRHLQ